MTTVFLIDEFVVFYRKRKRKGGTADISINLTTEEVFPGQSSYGKQPQFLLPYQKLFLYKWSRGTCVCVNVVEEEHPLLDRSMALPFLIGQREVTDKNRLL